MSTGNFAVGCEIKTPKQAAAIAQVADAAVVGSALVDVIAAGRDRAGNVWDNAAMESFFSSLKTERTARKTYRTRDQAKADVFDYIERFYNPKRRHSTLGYLSPVEFENQGRLA